MSLSIPAHANSSFEVIRSSASQTPHRSGIQSGKERSPSQTASLSLLDRPRSDGSSLEHYTRSLTAAISPHNIQKRGTTQGAPIVTWGNHLIALPSETTRTIESVCSAIENAEHEILFQIYQWSDKDESAQHVVTALNGRIDRALAVEGGTLTIRIVINRAISSWFRREHQPLRDMAARIKSQLGSDSRVYMELAYYPGPLLNVLHSKSLIIDGRQALVLTGNLKTHNALMSQDWYNMASCWTGPVVHTLRSDWLDGRKASSLAVSSAKKMPATSSLDLTLPVTAASLGASVLTRRSNWWYLNSGSGNPQDRGLLALIGAASTSITALNPALNAPMIVDALSAAVTARNVQVQLLLSLNMDRCVQHWFGGGDNSDIAYQLTKLVLHRGGERAASLLQIGFASSGNGLPTDGQSKYNIHAKNTAFDDICLMTGSMNWDWQSWNNSRELSVAAFGGEIVESWKRSIFKPLWALAAPMRAQDIPQRYRNKSNPVFTYLKKRETTTD